MLWALLGPVYARRVLAWTYENEAEAAQQLREEPGLFDGVYVGGCGVNINNTDPLRPTLYVTKHYRSTPCATITSAVKELGLELHIWLGMDNSANTIPHGREHEVDMTNLVASSVAAAKEHGWAGINFDDESETCPRRSEAAFKAWVDAQSTWARGLEEQGIQLSSDVQSLSCTSCSPWPACLESAPHPEGYAAVGEAIKGSAVHRWIEMDTYYGTLPYFYDQLDFYLEHVPLAKLGVGVLPNANPTDEDRTVARIYALAAHDVPEIDVFRLPLEAEVKQWYFPALRKWKTRCKECACGGGVCGELACWSGPCKKVGESALVRRTRLRH